MTAPKAVPFPKITDLMGSKDAEKYPNPIRKGATLIITKDWDLYYQRVLRGAGIFELAGLSPEATEEKLRKGRDVVDDITGQSASAVMERVRRQGGIVEASTIDLDRMTRTPGLRTYGASSSMPIFQQEK